MKKWHHHQHHHSINPPPPKKKKKKKLLQGFEFSLQERTSGRASKKKLCCNFSRSFFVQMLLLVLLRPDLCKASERASERENWRSEKEKQKSNRRAAAVDLRMGPAPSLPCLPPLTPFD
jgi:hypothetical protein